MKPIKPGKRSTGELQFKRALEDLLRVRYGWTSVELGYMRNVNAICILLQ